MKIIVPVQTRSRGSTQSLEDIVNFRESPFRCRSSYFMSNTRHLASLSNSPSRPLGTAIACVQCCIDLLNPSVVCHNLCIWTQIFDSLGAASSLSSGFSSLHREPKSIKRLKTREMNCRRIRELPTSLQRLCHLILKDKDVTVKAARQGYSTPPPRR